MRKKVNIEELKPLPENERKNVVDDILHGKFPENETAVVGENRGQLFVRIPKFVRERLNLSKGQKIHFKVYNENGKAKLEVEVIKHG
jgi:hypothetical protein